MNYEIFSDVSLDVDMSIIDKYNVKFIPMQYMLGDETYDCQKPESDEMMHHYYDKLREKVETHTSQIVPNMYMEAFEPYVKEGKAIIYISLSSGLSNTYESALLAVENLKEMYDNVQIEVVDSLGATGGMGLMVEKAVENREKGMSLEENAKYLRDLAPHVLYWFVVEDLMYLKRGGRVSGATAVVGTALNIKPILVINPKGKLDTVEKKRGSKQALKLMLEKFNETYDAQYGTTVYISCADNKENAERLKAMILEVHPELIVKVTMLSPIIGAHTGPDMVALIYGGTQRAEAK